MGSKSAVLRMHHDRWWEFGAADTQHSKFVNSAATAEWEGEGKNDGCKGWVTACAGDRSTSH